MADGLMSKEHVGKKKFSGSIQAYNVTSAGPMGVGKGVLEPPNPVPQKKLLRIKCYDHNG
jgi:hypothetical protein